jgi:long-chain acyl-CoA synthetase
MMDIAEFLSDSQKHLTDEERRWMPPHSCWAETAAVLGWSLNRMLMKVGFRLDVVGIENLPAESPYLLTPNHTSSLDPPLLAAALPGKVLRNTYWIARRKSVMRNFVSRKLGRWGHVIPFDRRRDGLSALAVAAQLLQRGRNVVWFPEGRRTTDGSLQAFKFGIGALLDRFDVPAVPIHLRGAYEALPPGSRWPRLGSQLIVRFGEPFDARRMESSQQGVERYQQLADGLHDVIASMAV